MPPLLPIARPVAPPVDVQTVTSLLKDAVRPELSLLQQAHAVLTLAKLIEVEERKYQHLTGDPNWGSNQRGHHAIGKILAIIKDQEDIYERICSWIDSRLAILEQTVAALRFVVACLGAWQFQYPLSEDDILERLKSWMHELVEKPHEPNLTAETAFLLEARRTYATGLLAIALTNEEYSDEAVRNGMATTLCGFLRRTVLGDDPAAAEPPAGGAVGALSSSSGPAAQVGNGEGGEAPVDPVLPLLQQRYAVQCLTCLGEYMECLGPVLQEQGVAITLTLLRRWRENRTLLAEVLRMLCSLLAHRKFAELFVEGGGVSLLLAAPLSIHTNGSISLALFGLAALPQVFEKVCALPQPTIVQITHVIVSFLNSAYDPARKNACLFLGAALTFPAVCNAFDRPEVDGLRALLNLIRTVTMLLRRSHHGELRSEKQIGYHALFALRTYFRKQLRSHLLGLQRRLGTAQLPADQAPYKSVEVGSDVMEGLLGTLEQDRRLAEAFVRRQWGMLEVFMDNGGPALMMDLLQQLPMERYCSEMALYALEVLQLVTLMPYTRRTVLGTPLANHRPGVSILLAVAGGHTFVAEHEVMCTAVNVLANCVSVPPSLVPLLPSCTARIRTAMVDTAGPLGSWRAHKFTPGPRDRSSPNNEASTSTAAQGPQQATGGDAHCNSLASHISHVYKYAIAVVRANNGIRVLLSLLQSRSSMPSLHVDKIRALTCHALIGLARDSSIRHILGKLQVGRLLAELVHEPPGTTNGTARRGAQSSGSSLAPINWHAVFNKAALELIALTTDAGIARGGTAAAAPETAGPALHKIERAAIAAATNITYPPNDLLLLIHEHLRASGLYGAASALAEEAKLSKLIPDSKPHKLSTLQRPLLEASPAPQLSTSAAAPSAQLPSSAAPDAARLAAGQQGLALALSTGVSTPVGGAPSTSKKKTLGVSAGLLQSAGGRVVGREGSGGEEMTPGLANRSACHEESNRLLKRTASTLLSAPPSKRPNPAADAPQMPTANGHAPSTSHPPPSNTTQGDANIPGTLLASTPLQCLETADATPGTSTRQALLPDSTASPLQCRGISGKTRTPCARLTALSLTGSGASDTPSPLPDATDRCTSPPQGNPPPPPTTSLPVLVPRPVPALEAVDQSVAWQAAENGKVLDALPTPFQGVRAHAGGPGLGAGASTMKPVGSAMRRGVGHVGSGKGKRLAGVATGQPSEPTANPYLLDLPKRQCGTAVAGVSTPLCSRPSNKLSMSAAVNSPPPQPPYLAAALRDCRVGAPVTSTLNSIVMQYLRHQHRLACLQASAPISTLPPITLLKPHALPQAKRCLDAPTNICNRLLRSQAVGACGGMGGPRLNRHFVYSRFRHVRSLRDDSVIQKTCAFVNGFSSLVVGNHAGEVKLYDAHGGELVETYEAHTAPVHSIEAYGMHQHAWLLTSSRQDVKLWGLDRMDSGPLHTWAGYRGGIFSRAGDKVAAMLQISPEASIFDVNTGQSIVRLHDSINGSPSAADRNPRTSQRSILSFSRSDDLLLCGSTLWDPRTPQVIHRFDQFTDYCSSVLHPNGMEAIINSEVWDVRSFKLLRSVTHLEGTSLKFNATDDVMYATLRRPSDDIGAVLHRSRHPLNNNFRTVDAVDYSHIATTHADGRCVLDLAADPSDSYLAVVTVDMNDNMTSSVRIYEVGRQRPLDDESDVEDEDDDEGDDVASESDVLLDDEDDLMRDVEGVSLDTTSSSGSDVMGSSDSDGLDSEDDLPLDDAHGLPAGPNALMEMLLGVRNDLADEDDDDADFSNDEDFSGDEDDSDMEGGDDEEEDDDDDP